MRGHDGREEGRARRGRPRGPGSACGGPRLQKNSRLAGLRSSLECWRPRRMSPWVITCMHAGPEPPFLQCRSRSGRAPCAFGCTTLGYQGTRGAGAHSCIPAGTLLAFTSLAQEGFINQYYTNGDLRRLREGVGKGLTKCPKRAAVCRLHAPGACLLGELVRGHGPSRALSSLSRSSIPSPNWVYPPSSTELSTLPAPLIL
mmetsp:Transcript_54243/g.90413  ORF Transcript_54243/g.90413 Transcript_54243/m.90413 type:complete len:201 (-) Transcript_54243:751-1353(-)